MGGVLIRQNRTTSIAALLLMGWNGRWDHQKVIGSLSELGTECLLNANPVMCGRNSESTTHLEAAIQDPFACGDDGDQ